MTGFILEPCASCQVLVIWAVTTKANRMPVDPEPCKEGNVALEHRGVDAPLARVLNNTQRFGRTDLRTSHFQTCPQAASWRKRGRS